jgi:hypothetical protein
MNTFQRSICSTQLAQGLTASALGRWAAHRWIRARLERWSLPEDRQSPARALPPGIPVATRSFSGSHLRSDPAWVSGVFSGFRG